jgi:hypothetical protein
MGSSPGQADGSVGLHDRRKRRPETEIATMIARKRFSRADREIIVIEHDASRPGRVHGGGRRRRSITIVEL